MHVARRRRRRLALWKSRIQQSARRRVADRRRFNAALRRLRAGAPKRKRDDAGGWAPVVDLTLSDCARAFMDMRWRAHQEYRELRTPAAWAPVAADIRARVRRMEECDCILTLPDEDYPCPACREHAAAIPRAIEMGTRGARQLDRSLEAALQEVGRNPRDADAVDAARRAFTLQHTREHRMQDQDAQREASHFCAALRAYRLHPSDDSRFWALVASLRPAKWARARAAGCVDAATGVPRERCLQRDLRGRTEMDRLREVLDKEIRAPTPEITEKIQLYLLLGSEYPLDTPPPVNLLPASTQWGSWEFSPTDPNDSQNLVIRDIGAEDDTEDEDEEEDKPHPRARRKGKRAKKRKSREPVTVDLT